MSRSLILPDYLQSPAWLEFLDVIDTVFSNTVDAPTKDLAELRFNLRLTAQAEVNVEVGSLISTSSLNWFDRETNLKMLRMSGLLLSDSSVFTDEQLQRLTQSLPAYWYAKGSSSLQGFLSYVFNSDLVIHQLWTQDYVSFYRREHSAVGDPVYTSGGTWYPTSHVALGYPSGFTEDEVKAFRLLFLAISPYVLVLHSVDLDISLKARAAATASYAPLAPYVEIVYVGAEPETQTCFKISQIGPPNTSVDVFMDGVLIGSVTSDSAGSWQLLYCSLTEGAHTLRYETAGLTSPTTVSPTVVFPEPQYFTSVLYPTVVEDTIAIPLPETGAVRLWGIALDDASVSLPSIQSGSLVQPLIPQTYNNPIEDISVAAPTIQSGSLTTVLVVYNNPIEDLAVLNVPSIQSGTLNVTISYVNYTNGLIEDVTVATPTIQSGTLA